ncbi:G8 domain-containing protein [Tenacibaculum agarivorans]|uniref:G8 domain-containing protein n=1 Tax=Tenacibaculum agarivorans TaxID=1908389 RepID=UPI0009F8FE37|nr:G8 domain-containing protein [Tenacibaculum agarivorans]
MKSIAKKYSILLIIVFMSVSKVIAQLEITARNNETLKLTASHFEGSQEIQWQYSSNKVDWNDIEGATTNNYVITLKGLPRYYRARIETPNCDTFYSNALLVKKPVLEKFLWSELATWGTRGKPEAGEEVMIPKDKHIILDENPPALGKIMVMGTLEFARKDLSLTAENIMVHGGEFIVGTPEESFTHKAIITLTDTDTEAANTRGIMVMMGGKLELHGASPAIAWTKINDHAEDGATKLVLKEGVNWKVGDEIVVGPTDFYEAANGKSITQRIKISAVNGKNISLEKGLEAFHWGKLQYATNNGMSLTEQNIVPTPEGDFLYGIQPNNPKVLDQRAPVGNLTRNIVVQSPDDAAWKDQGFGVHIMIMRESEAHLDGVEIKRGGQRGKLGRYPFHWHMLSYKGSENLGDATGQYIKNSTINVSMNRGIVVHGTNGTLVQNNIVYDVKGHGIFTEDAAERRNTFDGNLVLKVRNPEKKFALKKHELSGDRKGSSGFWISNPDNTTKNNHVADSEGNGFWLAFPDRPFGESAGALYEDGKIMNPGKMPFGTFEYNTAHSCKADALHSDNPEKDEEGNTRPSVYTAERSGRPGNHNGNDMSSWLRFAIKRFSGWKSTHGIWDRANFVNTLEATAADNFETCFAGAGNRGLILGGLVVGRSLNYAKNESSRNNSPVRNAFASYHHTFDVQGNIAINFPPILNKRSGVFGMYDYYVRPVEKGHWLSVGNILINSHPGVKITANESEISWQIGGDTPHVTFSGATWDYHGYWGPKKNYLVYDRPFYYGKDQKDIQVLAPWSKELNGGVSVPGPFYGLDEADIKAANGSSENLTDMIFTRYDENLNVVDKIQLYETTKASIQWFKHAALQKGGIFEVSYPSLDGIYDLQVTLDNLRLEEDEIVLAIEFTGTKNAKVFAERSFTDHKLQDYTKVNSLQEVKKANEASYWQDKTNNKVWIKVIGGLVNFPLNINARWEPHIYQGFDIRITEDK